MWKHAKPTYATLHFLLGTFPRVAPNKLIPRENIFIIFCQILFHKNKHNKFILYNRLSYVSYWITSRGGKKWFIAGKEKIVSAPHSIPEFTPVHFSTQLLNEEGNLSLSPGHYSWSRSWQPGVLIKIALCGILHLKVYDGCMGLYYFPSQSDFTCPTQ